MSKKQTSIKSKLFKLKEWLTIPETGKHLSIMFGEEVTMADVLRLGLDGHLTLSVNLVNHAFAKKGDKFLPFNEWEEKFKKEVSWKNAEARAIDDGCIAIIFKGIDMAFYIKEDGLVKENDLKRIGPDDKLKNLFLKTMTIEEQKSLLNGMVDSLIESVRKQSERYCGKVPPSIRCFTGPVSSIEGIWDLPMLGAERIDVEHKYQMETNGPEVTLINIDGTFVLNTDGVVFMLQDVFDKEYIGRQNSEERKQKDLDYYRKILEKRITNKEIDEMEAKKLLKQKEDYLNKPRNNDDNYYPAGGLPNDSVLVVRTKALIDLQKRLSESDSNSNKPLDQRSETTYLNIIGAMLETLVHRSHGDVDFSSEAKLREFLSLKYDGFRGLTGRTLAEKFAAAKRAIDENDY